MNVTKVGASLGLAARESGYTLFRQLGYTWVGAPATECPQTLMDIRKEANACQTKRQLFFRVSHDDSENTIYGDRVLNMYFRFWHDMVHLHYNLDMTLMHELQAGAIHVADIKRMGYSLDHQNLMWVDTCGQSLYCYITGRFPTNQLRFAESVIRFYEKGQSLEQAVRSIATQGEL